MRKSVMAGLVLITAGLMLGGCETPTPYQPAVSATEQNGYSSQKIEDNRYQVSFSGNGLTSRQTVETYLLYRAAELTAQQGYDWFEMAHRHTQREGRTVIDAPLNPGPYGWWSPSWRYHGYFGWRTRDPYWGGPYWADQVNIRTINRYDATAEIVMYKGAKPQNDPRAFDAHEVMQNLGPNIQRPPVK
jgi:hypothetical protein